MSRMEVDKSQPHKVSTVFLDYAEPFLQYALYDKKNPTAEELNFVIRTPWIIWNAYYMQQHGDKVDYVEWLSSLIKAMPVAAHELVHMLTERRKNEFSQHDYLIGEYTFYIDKKTNEMRFRAESRKMTPQQFSSLMEH